MAETTSSITGKARAVFSDAARVRLLTTDAPIGTVDPETGYALTYRFEAMAGGVLRISGGTMGDRVLAVGCDPEELNLVATLLLDGLKVRLP
jgi:hypothetical protein